jgi:hypothetical protein
MVLRLVTANASPACDKEKPAAPLAATPTTASAGTRACRRGWCTLAANTPVRFGRDSLVHYQPRNDIRRSPSPAFAPAGYGGARWDSKVAPIFFTASLHPVLGTRRPCCSGAWIPSERLSNCIENGHAAQQLPGHSADAGGVVVMTRAGMSLRGKTRCTRVAAPGASQTSSDRTRPLQTLLGVPTFVLELRRSEYLRDGAWEHVGCPRFADQPRSTASQRGSCPGM